MTEKTTRLINAIGQLDRENKEHFTAAGLPQTKALEEVVGEDVSAAERDEAWQLFQDMATAVVSVAEKKDSGVVTGQDVLKHLRQQGHRV